MLNPLARMATTNQKYITGWVPVWTAYLDSDIRTPLPYFTGGSKVRNLASFDHQVAFEVLWFRNEATYLKPSTLESLAYFVPKFDIGLGRCPNSGSGNSSSFCVLFLCRR